MTPYTLRRLLEAIQPTERRIHAARGCLDAAEQTPVVLATRTMLDEALAEVEKLRWLIDPLDTVGYENRRAATEDAA